MIEHIQQWLPTMVAGGAIALLWNDIRGFKKDLIEKTEQLAKSTEAKATFLAADTAKKAEEVAKTLRESLFRHDGQSVYMPRGACEREQLRCQTLTCGKIDLISIKLDEMNKNRETAKEAHVAQMGDIRQGLALLADQVDRLLEINNK